MKKRIVMLFAIGLMAILITNVHAEPPLEDYHAPRSNPHYEAPKSNLETAIDDALQILLDQGLAGVFILCLIVWTVKESKANRSIQKEQFDKFVSISQECSSHMASVSARLENIEREAESSKQILMLSRKG